MSKDPKEKEDLVFKEGEIIWAFHTNMLYKAKVLKVQEKSTGNNYFVHYDKWNVKWDEWIPPGRMRKDGEEVKKEAADLKIALKAKPKKAGGVKRKREAPEVSKRTRNLDPTIEPEDERMARQEIKIKLPGQLKKRLITDWELVTRQKEIVPLPRKPNVRTILDAYLKSKTRHAETLQMTTEMTNGLQGFFDNGLSTVLLYRFERPQYYDYFESQGETPPAASEVYGAEHLARLLVKLPELLSHTQITPQEATLLQQKLAEFTKWFAVQDRYFMESYQKTDSGYLTRLRELEDKQQLAITKAADLGAQDAKKKTTPVRI